MSSDVQKYCTIIKDKYKHQPIIPTDWPPRIGKDFFGRLTLIETRDASLKTCQQKAWYMLRGQVDKITEDIDDNAEISIQDIFKPRDNDGQSLRVAIDGPPGIGKTSLCHKVLNMWANGEIEHIQYDLMLYCPLRNDKVAQANSLEDLCLYRSPIVSNVIKWITATEGEGLLIIFDGWDELSTDLRKSSLATYIIRREMLDKCSVIVTSRSYATSSLIEIAPVIRCIEVMGFSKKEVVEVVEGILEKEPNMATELIEELEMREDIKSLCYIPLICSLVILVYRKSDGYLPATLTELYENFILQTIRRHVKLETTHNIEPRHLNSLVDLPPTLATHFKEMCKFAYVNLSEENPIMSFNSGNVCQSLDQSMKEDFLGLMTVFTVYDEEMYQFLHLTIQEFLAAWWIAKHEKSEVVFIEHFDDDHFRMCLRFVAGLTHLEQESYQQFFNKKIVPCRMIPLFGSKVYSYFHFCQNSELFNFIKLDILLLHLLHESQNTQLCEGLSQSMKKQSLCLKVYGEDLCLSLFDFLCFSHFLNKSNETWNYLDMGRIRHEAINIFANALSQNNHVQCKRLKAEMIISETNIKSVTALFQSSFCHNLQECYIGLDIFEPPQYLPNAIPCILLQLIKLQHLERLHFTIGSDMMDTKQNVLLELEESLCNNTTLHELVIKLPLCIPNTISIGIINCVIKGVTKNKSIQSFSLNCDRGIFGMSTENTIEDKVIENLLKENCTLKALALNLPDEIIPPIDILEVTTPLKALKIGQSHQLTTLLPQHIKGLHCLIHKNRTHPFFPLLLVPQYTLSYLFQSNCNLQQLEITLDRAETVIELFTILQSNTTLKVLTVCIKENSIFETMGPSLQDMLGLNQTIEYLQVRPFIPICYLSFLTAGLVCNTTLKGLDVFIPLSDTNPELKALLNVISGKNKLTELKVDFILNQPCVTQRKTQLFYENGLPLITDMLRSHKTIDLLDITTVYVVDDLDEAICPSRAKLSLELWTIVFFHSTLQYIGIHAVFNNNLKCALALTHKYMKENEPQRTPPIINLNFSMHSIFHNLHPSLDL